jgi:hypothetical protein
MDWLSSEIFSILLIDARENKLVSISGLAISSCFFLCFLAMSRIFGSGGLSSQSGNLNKPLSRGAT